MEKGGREGQTDVMREGLQSPLLALRVEQGEGGPQPSNLVTSDRWNKQGNRFSHGASRLLASILVSAQ